MINRKCHPFVYNFAQNMENIGQMFLLFDIIYLNRKFILFSGKKRKNEIVLYTERKSRIMLHDMMQK